MDLKEQEWRQKTSQDRNDSGLEGWQWDQRVNFYILVRILYPEYHSSTLKSSGPLQNKDGLILKEIALELRWINPERANTRALSLPGSPAAAINFGGH